MGSRTFVTRYKKNILMYILAGKGVHRFGST